jgi:sterol desaturase/sphingolipid hydroxylase (fatty acid hydroxylase superfamily)
MTLSDIIPDLNGGVAVLIMLTLFGAGALMESAVPIEKKQPRANTRLNIAYAIFTGWLGVAIGPLMGVAATTIINAAGGGWIALPDSGWGLAYSAIVYLLAIDLLEYAFHRAQHAWPLLWAMHSFHHSDPGVNVTTTARHYWLEMPLKALFVYPLLAVLLKVPPTVLVLYALSTIWHYVNHLNVRWRFPITWKLINNPQFHRIHHSLLPQHQNRNFAPYFPLWDLIFGTAYAPAPGEYPPTGLAEEPGPTSFAVAFGWPFRRLWRLLPAGRTT